MAETLISPGVLTRENDQSLITQQPIQAGFAVIGPTVKGPVLKPRLVTSYSQYKNIFGTTFESGSREFTFLTSISAYNYFQQGGTTLLVTRVTSGSFTPATSEDDETGILTDTSLSSLITQFPNDASASTYSNISATTDGAGVDALFTVTIENDAYGSTGYGSIQYSPDLASIVASTSGFGYQAGDTITIASSSIGGGTMLKTGSTLSLTTPVGPVGAQVGTYTQVPLISSGNGQFASGSVVVNSGGEVQSVTINSAPGIGYEVGQVITIHSSSLGATGASGTNYTFTLVASDMAVGTDLVITLDNSFIINPLTFVLETLSEGIIMNSESPLQTNGVLPSGTADNLRFEVTAPNTSSGTFSLLIRRGNDTQKEKVILEQFDDLSLDPFSKDYIAKRIGDIDEQLVLDNGEYFLRQTGTYLNRSRYVRVKSVLLNTPNYFDNNGEPKAQFKSLIPQAYSGTFASASGDILPSGRAGNYYTDIGDLSGGVEDTQGLIGSDYDIAISLLKNKDEYRYNLLTMPGLTLEDNGAQLTVAADNARSRGDFLVLADPVQYGRNIRDAVDNNTVLNTSYAATYWPWLQTIDPDTGRSVFVPASTMLPGVFAFNDNIAEPWFAPAGINRGSLPGVLRAERRLTQANRDTLYNNNLNPIATFPNSGVVVFGQKTTQKATTALDRVNVRRLLIALKSFISQVADNLVFEQNTVATRNNFLAQVNPYLASVQERQGLFAFKVVMDESNNTPDVIDRNQLVGQIFIQPTRTAEFIILDFNVLPTGAEFPE